MSDMDVDEPASSQPRPTFSRDEIERELDQKYPDRPHNHSETLPFRSLFQDLFNPLNANKNNKSKAPPGVSKNRPTKSPHEVRRAIIERFISRWRREVGNDIYPAFRLIIPDKDRERAMYGLKEKVLGKFLVKIMQIDKNSEDGQALLNWKLPGRNVYTQQAGEFAGRCYEVISKRPILIEPGDMTIGEVNDELDKLSAASKEEKQLPILRSFYQRMNADELTWLIRIILRAMAVGATERTIFDIWHPDANSLFNVSSSLRRVCWELYNPSVRLEGEDRGVNLMQCFQPQLAQFQVQSLTKMVEKMRPTEEDAEFWIEEKLDGERMQMHMINDDSVGGGKRFKFWSRKAKDYTYLYGESFIDDNAALTRHIRSAFREGVENIILDGEMITWDPEQDMMLPFGTLKTAAKAEQSNPFAGKQRPLFRVFDILYLNDHPLTRYTLRDRRKALERSIASVHRRLELIEYKIGTQVNDIEPELREVVAQASEGLVLKNPRSAYHLNSRNDDWLKVKPEYMTEFGESLDCLVIGGYYGSGRRGGALSSFLCGLRVDEDRLTKGKWHPQLFWSFFRVGGGLDANDYATIRHMTDGKWKDWDYKNPPTYHIELGGGDLQREKPDVWIKPEDSFVVEVKAAQVSESDDFRMGKTLRFPRFKRIRADKDWESALSVQGLLDLKVKAEKEQKQKELKMEDDRKKKRKLDRKPKMITVAGYAVKEVNGVRYAGAKGKVFDGLTFYILTEATKPEKSSKLELEEMVKANGGKVVQSHKVKDINHIICVAERRTVKVASLQKAGDVNVIKPIWLFDCITQSRVDFAKGLPEIVVPLELERHLYFVVEDEKVCFEDNVDEYGDSYARDTSVQELREVMGGMARVEVDNERDISRLVEQMEMSESEAWLFRGLSMYFDSVAPPDEDFDANETREPELEAAMNLARFAGAKICHELEDKSVTQIIVHRKSNLQAIRREISSRNKIPRLATTAWIEESWREKTLLDAERFAPDWK